MQRPQDHSSKSNMSEQTYLGMQSGGAATLVSNVFHLVGDSRLAYDEEGEFNLISTAWLNALYEDTWHLYTRWCYEELESGCMAGHFVISRIELLKWVRTMRGNSLT